MVRLVNQPVIPVFYLAQSVRALARIGLALLSLVVLPACMNAELVWEDEGILGAESVADTAEVPSLSYGAVVASYSQNAPIGGNSPAVGGSVVVSSYSVAPTLPTGLSLNATTGVISGTPLAVTASASYIVTAIYLGGVLTSELWITVTPPVVSLAQSTLSVATSTVAAGVGDTVTLVARDASGIQLSSGGLTVAFGIIGGTSVGTFGSVSDNGDGTYSANFTGSTAGTATQISATIGGGAVTSTMPSVTVNSGVATTLVFTVSPPSNAVYATNFSVQPTIKAQDAFGNTNAGFVSPVTLTSFSDSVCATAIGPISATVNPLSASGGVATFSGVKYAGAGTIYLRASGGALSSACSGAIVVSAGVPTLSFSGSTGTSGSAGSSMSVTPTSWAENGATITGCSSSPALPSGLSINSNSCVITGTPTVATASTIYTITATNSAGSSTGAVVSLSVSAGAVSQLVFTTAPSSFVTAGAGFATLPIVEARDAFGNTNPSYTSAVSLVPHTNGTCTSPAGGTLSGGSATAVAGISTFASLSYTLAETIYLKAYDGTRSACSSAISVSPGTASLAQSVVTVGSASVVNGATTTVVLTAIDAMGNYLTSGGLWVDFVLLSGSSVGTFGATTDGGDGTYSAVFTASVPGTAASVAARIAGSNVTSALPAITVITPASLLISDGSTYNYTTQPAGSTMAKTFTVTNSGETAATLATVSTAGLGLGSPYSLTAGGTCATGGLVGASGGTCTLIVTYAPTTGGTVGDSIDLGYHDGVANQLTSRALSGTATTIALSPSSPTISLNGTVTFSATGGNAPYTYSITSGAGSGAINGGSGLYTAPENPLTATVLVTDNMGYTASTSVTVNCTTLTGISVSPVYPINGANWNDYVKNYGSGTSPYNRDDIACVGTELGFTKCIHGGEKKKIVVSGQSSCAGLAATDSLGAFEWVCDNSSGVATFYSIGLKKYKGLSDLLVSDTSFFTNSVAITKTGCGPTLLQSSSSTWWSNPIQALSPNGGGAVVSLSNPGTIYTYSGATASAGYNIAADRVSVVGWGGGVLSFNGTGYNCNSVDGSAVAGDYKALLCTGSKMYLWIEGTFKGSAASQATLVIRSAKFSRIHKSLILNGSLGNATGLDLDWCTSSAIQHSEFQSNPLTGNGVVLANSSYNLLSNVRTAHNGNAGISLLSGSGYNTLFQAFSSNDHISFLIENSSDNYFTLLTSISADYDTVDMELGSSRNTFVGLTTVNANTNGIWLGNGSNSNTFVNSALVNNMDGIHIDGSSSNFFHDMAIGHNPFGNPIVLDSLGGAPSNNSFLGELLVGYNNGLTAGDTCTIAGTGNSINGSCAGTGLTTTSGVSLAGSFVGKATSDSSSTVDTGGVATYATVNAAPSNWFQFENIFRGWGMSGTVFPAASNQGRCLAGSCQIWDTRLKAADLTLLNKFGAFSAGAPCPTSALGSNTVSNHQVTPITFLKTAVEIPGDLHNNGNGLCESNEHCLYTPNLGGYQGELSYRSQTCNFTNGGTVQNVTLFAFQINGS